MLLVGDTESDPLVPVDEFHVFAELVPFAQDHVSVEDDPAAIVAGLGDSEQETALAAKKKSPADVTQKGSLDAPSES